MNFVQMDYHNHAAPDCPITEDLCYWLDEENGTSVEKDQQRPLAWEIRLECGYDYV